MKKTLSLFMATTAVAACSTSGTAAKSSAKSDTNTNFVAYPLNRIGYITETHENVEDNYINKSLIDLKEEYGYRLDGTADAAYSLKYSTTRAFSTDSPKEFRDAFERLDQNNVGLTFIENNEHLKKLYEAKSSSGSSKTYLEYNLWKEIMENNIYQGYMVMIGEDSRFYKTKEDVVGTGDEKWEWKSDKIATFEYSEIISAYYMGYITQYTFGLTNDGEKQSVGYIVGATYEQTPDRAENIKKAVAFRQGVLDAQVEQATGEATFATKAQASDDAELHTLVRAATDLEEIVPNLVESSNYKNKDHSFVYFAGASSEYNELIANFLIEEEVTNKNGHNIIGERASTTSGDMFEASSDTNYIKATKTNDDGEEIAVKNKSVTGRVAMFFNEDKLGYRTSEFNIVAANKQAVEKVLKSIFVEDNLDTYFGKHTYIGTFPVIYNPGTREVPADATPAKSISQELKNTLWDKNLTEDQFKTQSDFLGWEE